MGSTVTSPLPVVKPQPVAVCDAAAPAADAATLTVSRISARELTDEQIRRWSQIQQANELLHSPFFRPEFTQAVAAVRHDVEVAVLKRGEEIVGFLPFQRKCRRLGRPVGARLNDFQGVICDATCTVDPAEMLRACGLLTWKFDHLVTTQPALESSCWLRRPSPYMNLAEGFAAFLANRQTASRRIREALRKMRNIERELGPIRFVPHSTDSRVFQILREWKSAQWRRTGEADVFGIPWTVELLERLNQDRSPDCCGMLSALYAGDRLIAVHQGLRSRSVLHSWFPAYEPSLARYSPGLMLFVRLAQEANSLGIRRIELGAGPARYKESLASDATMVVSGAITVSPLLRDVQRTAYRANLWVKSSPLRAPAQVVANWTRPLRGWLALR